MLLKIIIGEGGGSLMKYGVLNRENVVSRICIFQSPKDVNIHSIQGSHPTWKTWNFVIYFSRPGKYMEFAQKVGKTWNFSLKPGKKTWILKIWCFHINFSWCLYKNIIYIYVISKL